MMDAPPQIRTGPHPALVFIGVGALFGLIYLFLGADQKRAEPKTINCAEWRVMTDGPFMRGRRCERWEDGKTLDELGAKR